MSNSIIAPTAIIDKSVKIGPFCVIGPNVEIGPDCVLHSHVVIKGPTKINEGNVFYQFSTIGEDTPDKKYNGEDTTLEIGKKNIFREGVTVHRGTIQDKSKTIIGDENLFMAYSHIAHDCFVGDNCIFSNNTTLAGHVTVGDYVIISGLTAIHQFCSIGNHAFVTGGSLVRKDVPPFVKAAREPLSYVGINSVGLRRRGFDSKKIREIQNIYRLLYQKNYNNSQACEIIEAEMEASNERDEILMFIKNSHRGIMKGNTKSN